MSTKSISYIEAIRDTSKTHTAVAELFGISEAAVRRSRRKAGIELNKTNPAMLQLAEVAVKLPPAAPGKIPLKVVNGSNWVRFGLVSDTHLCCREERLDALNTQYDLFKAEGITNVLHAGNPIDGHVQRINGNSVYETTLDGQSSYFAKHYPQRDGIKTMFITGDDHESWFMREGLNVGAYMEMVARRVGRTDLQYIGHVESDVEVKVKGCPKSVIIKVQHPGGGSAFARSYTGQRQVDAFQGGEKPNILIQGHYHVSNYMIERNIHVISMPGFQDQTIFARKKRLRMEIGGAILEFKVNMDDGAVTRCRVEFNMFFDRGYYRTYLDSDKHLTNNHVIIKS